MEAPNEEIQRLMCVCVCVFVCVHLDVLVEDLPLITYYVIIIILASVDISPYGYCR